MRIASAARAGKGTPPEDPIAWAQFRAFDGSLENGNLLSQCKDLDGGSSASDDECPEEYENALKDSHELVHQMLMGLWRPNVVGSGGRGASSSGPDRLELVVYVISQVA